MSSQPVKGVIRQVKPLLSTNEVDCKRRVLALYKAWYRQIPEAIVRYFLPISATEGRARLRKEFMKHKSVRDIRVIDMLVIKGQMELKETVKGWKQESHALRLTKDIHTPKSTNFVSKFLSGVD